MKCSAALVALAVVAAGASAGAGMPESSAFSRACGQRLAAVQANLRVCVVGVVTGTDRIQVVHATAPDLLGRTVRLYQTSGVMSASRPIDGLRSLRGRMVVVGGQRNGESIYSARLL